MADFVSFDATGFTLDWLATSPTAVVGYAALALPDGAAFPTWWQWSTEEGSIWPYGQEE